MLDIKLIRENPDLVKENIKKKFQDQKLPLVDEVLAQASSIQRTANFLAELDTLLSLAAVAAEAAGTGPFAHAVPAAGHAVHAAGREQPLIDLFGHFHRSVHPSASPRIWD